ncbi:hypothetical protein OPV22_017363 [Ensete ventricosum]|uniref:Peptidase A1 domain-containing protein n=1 Tax=Ensete ventricosum TaxID=4639 RepID=A0AAV8R210_ENSVE|nr:hypothetical protein OPV22_017363 [Ensete ventricosum]RWW29007.1 hypothetical protein GW17_00006488 [Ensete ventricosum]
MAGRRHFLTALVILVSLAYRTSAAGSGGFSARLFSRDDSLPPNATYAEEEEALMRTSDARLRYLEARHRHMVSPDSVEAPIFRGTSQYLMNLTLGTPPVTIPVTFDTGSGVTWVQSTPCVKCHEQNYPLYDRSKSSSYKPVDCSSKTCKYDGYRTKCINGSCAYVVAYADNSYSIGVVGTEYFTFAGTDDDPKKGMVEMSFGVGLENDGIFSEDEGGLLGIDRTGPSLINQLWKLVTPQFSHCLIPKRNPGSSLVLFGKRAELQGDPTPLQGINSYYVQLYDITVGIKKLHIPPGTFDLDRGGLVLDTGTPLTYLYRVAFDMVHDELDKQVKLKRVGGWTRRQCFYGNYGHLDDGTTVPVLRFHFEGLEVSVPPTYYFTVDGNFVCSTLMPTDSKPSVYGSFMQQNFVVGYDLEWSNVYISPKDCTKL